LRYLLDGRTITCWTDAGPAICCNCWSDNKLLRRLLERTVAVLAQRTVASGTVVSRTITCWTDAGPAICCNCWSDNKLLRLLLERTLAVLAQRTVASRTEAGTILGRSCTTVASLVGRTVAGGTVAGDAIWTVAGGKQAAGTERPRYSATELAALTMTMKIKRSDRNKRGCGNFMTMVPLLLLLLKTHCENTNVLRTENTAKISM
jgi:hypothetical protein